ncbi:MAG: Gldg family protein [Rectinema sp.]
MKKFLAWIKSPSSDSVLFIILLVLANIVGQRAFLRFDLTGPKSYSLSPVSVQLVKTLREPLSIKVFFSENVPAPYNSVEQYLSDLLVEYKGAANRNFSYAFFDMDKPENQQLASDYGVGQVQIQQLSNNEVGIKEVWMGLAIVYQDSIKVFDSLTSTEGLEYTLTMAMSKMISTADALAGLGEDEKVKLVLYASEKLSAFDISGFDTLDAVVKNAYEAINKKNMGRIEFDIVNPSSADIPVLAQKYGIQTIAWENEDGSSGQGALGLVLEYKDNFRLIPLSMQRSLFGYTLVGLDALETTIADSLRSLMAKSTDIGYVTNHDEPSIYDQQYGAGNFNIIVSDFYTLKEIDLSKDQIPAGLTTLIINGPKKAFTDEELYKIDQFIMRGGNVLFFVDPFEVAQGSYYELPQYKPLDTGLGKLLSSYGVSLGQNYVMDEHCYTTIQQGYGKLSLPWAPLLTQRQLAPSSVITRNLSDVIFLQTSSVDPAAALANENLEVTVLAKSSPQSWLVSENIILNPLMTAAPSDKSIERSYDLAVLIEGKFRSAFEVPPSGADGNSSRTEGEAALAGEQGSVNTLESSTHLAESLLPGKIFVTGSSELIGAQLIDQDGSQPVSLFVRNVVDYMNGAADFCTMRTKGLSLNRLSDKNSGAAAAATFFNEFGLTILVAVVGLLVWRARAKRRERIRRRYNPVIHS